MNSLFFKSLYFWTWHCLINAFPSFLLAGIHLGYFGSASATLAMLSGILFFILAYSTIFTVVPWFHNPESRLTRALSLALVFRLVLMVIGMIGVMAPIIIFFHPDYYAGLAAFIIQQETYQILFGTQIEMEQLDSFFDIFLWTILEGSILTLFLLAFSLLALLVVGKSKKANCL